MVIPVGEQSAEVIGEEVAVRYDAKYSVESASWGKIGLFYRTTTIKHFS